MSSSTITKKTELISAHINTLNEVLLDMGKSTREMIKTLHSESPLISVLNNSTNDICYCIDSVSSSLEDVLRSNKKYMSGVVSCETAEYTINKANENINETTELILKSITRQEWRDKLIKSLENKNNLYTKA